MDLPRISQDDIEDVKEMSEGIENAIYAILDDHDLNVSMSALISASINAILSQCTCLDEIMFFRHVYIQSFDLTVRHMKIKGHENPPSS